MMANGRARVRAFPAPAAPHAEVACHSAPSCATRPRAPGQVPGRWLSPRPPGYPSTSSQWRSAARYGRLWRGAVRSGVQRDAGLVAGVEPPGFAFDLSLAQSDDPGSVGESDLERAVVTLPVGVRVSPSSADGLQGCSPDQSRSHDASAPSCQTPRRSVQPRSIPRCSRDRWPAGSTSPYRMPIRSDSPLALRGWRG